MSKPLVLFTNDVDSAATDAIVAAVRKVYLDGLKDARTAVEQQVLRDYERPVQAAPTEGIDALIAAAERDD